jgi:uncharacterized protein YecA (UPF0149 family)
MAKIEKKVPIPRKSTLVHLLMQSTRSELINTADLLAIRIKKSQTKGLIVKEIAQNILNTPFIYILQLPLQEVLKLKRMVYAQDHTVPFTPSILVPPTIHIGLSDVSFDGQQYTEYITPDLAKALESIIELAEGYYDNINYRNGQLILGLLNLYGLMEFRELKDLSAYHDPKLNIFKLEDAIMNSFVLKSCAMPYIGKMLYTSPYLDQPWYLYEELTRRKDITQARFTLNEVMDAGQWGAAMPPANPYNASFRHELSRLGKTEEEITDFMTNCWMLTNNDYDSMGMLKEILENYAMSNEAIQGFISEFMNWTNHLSRWILKGNSSNHVFENYEKSALQKRPPQEEVNYMRQEMHYDAKPKVGRNEPCPCNSGKKFKHCCLRN